jgi:hypothetical protein
MKNKKASVSHLKHLRLLFERNITVKDIAEPLATFDREMNAHIASQKMSQSNYDAMGVTTEGVVEGYVLRSDLNGGVVGDGILPFGDEDVLSDIEPLSNLLLKLHGREYYFVQVLGRVGGIVRKTDCQKAPIRMWLFGLITLLEMQITRLIRERYPGSGWERALTRNRISRARNRFRSRAKKNQEINVIECLELPDKVSIVSKDELLRRELGFRSVGHASKTLRRVIDLRNDIAHAYETFSKDWAELISRVEIVQQQLEKVERLSPPPKLQ